MQYPKILEAVDSSCLCNSCLHAKMVLQTHKLADEITPEQALQENVARALGKASNLIEGIDYYMEDEFFVFTKWHHLRKGYCCNNNCRHCPYKQQIELMH
jgi:hypothetical protein